MKVVGARRGTCTAHKGRVVCAMSGGVDSSVAAKLLVDAGYDVLGATMRLFDAAGAAAPEGAPVACSTRDQEDAQAVAARLGIPYHVYNYTGTFEECVVAPFCNAYLNGLTPNPCVDCNRTLKFGALQACRERLGYDYVATGHYVRRAYDKETGRYLLLRGLDTKKDQSYVLYHLTQDQLAHSLFPVGELSKEQTREVACETGLAVADKAESQDICFIPDGDYASFIQQHTGASFEPGPILDEKGVVLGQHKGLPHYTLGQRKGLGIAVGEPLFVLQKDVARNALVVGTVSSLGITEVVAENPNFISVATLDAPLRVTAKTNYRSQLRSGVAFLQGKKLVMRFDEPVRSVAPGQALVLYDGEKVVGGGTIVEGR